MARATGDLSSSEQGVFLVHLSRARKHLLEERYDVARKELELAQIARPNDEDVLNLLSVIEFKRGYYHESAQAARALLKDNPSSSILHSNLGLILFKAGVLGEAEQELRRAIELQPDHVRSHLYLGLLYRMRGKLGLALEHLRFAGAKRVVTEIEELLRRSMREPALRTGAEPKAPAAPAASAATPSILKLADAMPALARPSTRPTAAAFISREPSDPELIEFTEEPKPARIPTPVPTPLRPGTPPSEQDRPRPAEAATVPFPEAEFVEIAPGESSTNRPVLPSPIPLPPDAESRPLFHVRPDGGLEIASRGVVFVRKGSVVWYSGKMRFSPEASFRGTRLERILRADGRGYLFVNDPGRHAFRREIQGQSLYLEGSRILALDNGLSFRIEPIHDFRMNRRVDILKIFGRGSVILSVGGPLLAHEVSAEFPLNVSSRDLVAWTGDLVPSVLEDRFLEEVMMPDIGSAPKIRFEGAGTVLTEPPRPRRRASDLARPTEADRRS
jgi:uncharacterized protein (AIM24 family)